ncbi:MAG: hypothetical protein KDK40_00245, partial [Chlamydiia bacterium]|nr:hypothetical protein [Chlamydiia bacterium]
KEEFIPEQSYENARAATQQYISENLGVDPAASEVLSESIRVFKEFQDALVTHYIEQFESRKKSQDYFLLILNGWSEHQATQTRDLKKMPHQIDPRIFSEGFENTEGGYFIRWQGKGIAVNPGRQFLDSLHRSGLSVRDIDFVVVTRQNPEAFEDVKAIHQINYKLNAVKSDRLHLINYYLHQNAYRYLGSDLKANFKQEKNSVHCLDFYLDSPELEKVTLFEGCVLQYFPTTLSEINLKKGKEEEEKLQGALGVKFELTHENTHIRIGYLSGTGWTPYLASYLGGCDVLITGLEYVNKNDYEKVKYHEDALGYYGSISLLEEIAPRLLLCCEFGGEEGDIRLEVVHKMRKEFTPTTSRATTILPGDHGLSIDLLRFEINCSVTGVPVDPSKIHVVKTQDAFGKLLYLSSKTFI